MSMTPMTPTEISVLLFSHRERNPAPCRVCGSVMTIASAGGGEATKYVCAAVSYAFDDESRVHYRRSEQSIRYHGDPDISRALRELRALRAAQGEDMDVPIGSQHFPDGHGPWICNRFLEHRGGDIWENVWDKNYSHDCSHAPKAESS